MAVTAETGGRPIIADNLREGFPGPKPFRGGTPNFDELMSKLPPEHEIGESYDPGDKSPLTEATALIEIVDLAGEARRRRLHRSRTSSAADHIAFQLDQVLDTVRDVPLPPPGSNVITREDPYMGGVSLTRRQVGGATQVDIRNHALGAEVTQTDGEIKVVVLKRKGDGELHPSGAPVVIRRTTSTSLGETPRYDNVVFEEESPEKLREEMEEAGIIKQNS